MYVVRERENKMSEGKDPRIKLFGKTIQLPQTFTAAADMEEVKIVESVEYYDVAGEGRPDQEPPCSANSVLEDCCLNTNAEDPGSKKGRSGPEQDNKKDDNLSHPLTSLELKDSSISAEIDDQAVQTSKTEEDQTQTGNSPEKCLKKPEKILPCPRCNSMDTKFCYFNNYNTNQPRHFCKICQRYWTAGGTMRNVPVGAGRRKNKTSISQSRHMTVPEALQSARVDLQNGIHHLGLNPNGSALTFSSDAPLRESVVSVLNIAERAINNSSSNGFHRTGERRSCVSLGSIKTGGDQSSKSPIASSKNVIPKNGLQEPFPDCHPYTAQIQYFPGALQPYPWHSVQWSSPMAAPTIAPPSFPLPFYSAAPPFWGCAIPGSWSVPWVIPPTPTASHSLVTPSSDPISPTLGKHSRDDNVVKTVNPEGGCPKDSSSERFLWVPKTLRIDDHGEAAKSSIWATLGIKKDEVDSVSGGSLFKAFRSQSKVVETQDQETTTMLQANPAALSRSLSFQESS